jgi:hypothetical protein
MKIMPQINTLYKRFRGKTGLFPVFHEPVLKLTEFWNRLTLLKKRTPKERGMKNFF